MWLRNLSRDGNSRGGALSLGAVVAVAAALAMAGCSADYVENNESPVLLLITAINGGAQLDSDVRNGEDSTFACFGPAQISGESCDEATIGINSRRHPVINSRRR